MLNLQNIKDAKLKLFHCDTTVFKDDGSSFRNYLNQLKVNKFRHIEDFDCTFEHPVSVIAGTNKVGKTSLLLLMACSHERFMRLDSTTTETLLREHKWNDVLNFTQYENENTNYSYKLFWRVCHVNRQGEGQRINKAWTGLGKKSSDATRINAKIRDREVRLIDLERIHPTRNFSNSLMRKISSAPQNRLEDDIEKAFAYILEIPDLIQINRIGSHINKIAYLIISGEGANTKTYSSYNAASGEESLLNILVDIFEAPNNSLILIDEIEAGFHPAVQRRLADIIQYVAWNHKKQFIITTHSPSVIAAFPQKSRKYIDIVNGKYVTISNISVNAVFSKMDSKSYPLVRLYCEDDLASFIIKNIILTINEQHRNFNRLINIITSGPINQVKNDYVRHKRNYQQMNIKTGYCCVFDGDYKNDPNYSDYHQNDNEFSFFLYPYTAPEKFLVGAYLNIHPQAELSTALKFSDHHSLFQECVNLGLAIDEKQALEMCWHSFTTTPEYRKLKNDLTSFLLKVTTHFSKECD